MEQDKTYLIVGLGLLGGKYAQVLSQKGYHVTGITHSRSTLEMKDPASRPEVSSHVSNMDQYDTVFVSFPIWWYVGPHHHQYLSG